METMKKTLIALAAAALVAVGIINTPAQAGPSSVGTITVTGTGSVTLKRDQATTNIAVSLSADRAADAMSRATATYNAVRKAILELGIKADDLTTTGISLYPEWDYTPTQHGGKPVITGYRATISVQVTTTVLNAAKALDVATSVGGDAVSVNGLSFDVADPDAITDASRVRAVTNAKAKAKDYAEALGQRVGRAIKIVETGAAMPTPIYAPTTKGEAAVVDLDPGTQKVSSSVTITFELLG